MNREPRRVVGVVADVAYGARGETSRKLYLPHAQFADNRNWALTQTVRTAADLGSTEREIQSVISELDGQLVLHRPRAYENILADVRAQDRFATVLMGSFAGLALLLSLLGSYGVLAGSVAGRTREIGIRVALGADRPDVRRMVLRYAARITAAGVGLGLAGSWISRRWIEALLFEIDAGDPLTHLAGITLLVLTGLFAAWLPAARATRVDAVRVLTAE